MMMMNEADISRRSLLFEKIVDRSATQDEWEAVYELADADPTVWRELVELQRDQAALEGLAMAAGDRAAAVPAPNLSLADAARLNAAAPAVEFPSHNHGGSAMMGQAQGQGGLHRMPGWAGWAVAAVLFVVLATVMQGTRPITPGSGDGYGTTNMAGIVPVSSADEAMDAYLRLGRQEDRVIDELPNRVLVETRPLPTGEGFEIIYIRQLIERATVPELYQVESPAGEGASPNLVRYSPSNPGRM